MQPLFGFRETSRVVVAFVSVHFVFFQTRVSGQRSFGLEWKGANVLPELRESSLQLPQRLRRGPGDGQEGFTKRTGESRA